MSNCAVCHKPVTFGEVLDMDGEPVWIERGRGYWGLVDADHKVITISRGDCIEISSIIGAIYRRKPREWISVKKRPPEYDAPVWGWDAQCHCAKEVNYLNGEFFDVFGEDADITHWMPLPAPPEVE